MAYGYIVCSICDCLTPSLREGQGEPPKAALARGGVSSILLALEILRPTVTQRNQMGSDQENE